MTPPERKDSSRGRRATKNYRLPKSSQALKKAAASGRKSAPKKRPLFSKPSRKTEKEPVDERPTDEKSDDDKPAKQKSVDGKPAKQKRRIHPRAELVGIIAIAIGLALLIQTFIIKPYKIPSGSMEPTLAVGQRVLTNRISPNLHVGAIAVFHPPKNSEEQLCGPEPHLVRPGGAACTQPRPDEETKVNYIKRIVAGPGDEIYISEGHVYRKAAGTSTFVREHDPYIKPCGGELECNFPTPIKIAPGHWFMMGDNRGKSDDSRYWGPVPRKWIIGTAFATYWPPDRIGFL